MNEANKKDAIDVEFIDIKQLTLEDIFKRCQQSKGYTIFIATVSNKRDENGNAILNFDYLRSHFAIEDLKASFDQFRKMITEDANKTAKSLAE